ncbi:MAG: hypothetical protein ACFFDY_02865 [Candidatus Thorarchaeota archaeon]
MDKYNLDIFLDNIFDWVDSFKVNGNSGHFSVERDKKKQSLYGICDIVYNLVIPNQLDHYLELNINEDLQKWIEVIQSFQDPKTGWIKEPGFNFGLHFKEHSSAFATSVLKLLDSSPSYDFKISKKLDSKKKVERWLKRVPEWGVLFWPGSHRGGGIGAIFATLGKESYPHENFFDWYFDWLDRKADPNVGFWRLGWNHKIKRRLTKHELGGSIHYYWIYEFLNHPIPCPEKVIDSTLLLQNNLGLWDGDISYCIDLDAIFCLTRCSKKVKGYRENDIKKAILKYLNYTIPSLNDSEFLFTRYNNTHKLTGCLGAIAEIQKFYPELFDFPNSWIQTLDITPWI